VGETLSGEIRRITYHNPDSQWTVARLLVSASHADLLPLGAAAVGSGSGGGGGKFAAFKRKGKKGAGAGATGKERVVTVVGHIPGVAEGQNLQMTGDWRDVERWGMQFVLNAMPDEVEPEDEDGILRYLSGGVLPGVGKVTAGKLVTHFGTRTFEVFDSPEAVRQLCGCPGVGAKTAEKLKASWDKNRGRRDACAFLEQHGVAPALAQRAATAHGARTEERVRADPFGALAGLRGATFHRCDVLAAKLGKAPDDRARLAAAMLQVLQASAVRDGHVFLPWGQLCDGVGRLLGARQAAALTKDALHNAADELLGRGAIVRAAMGVGVGGGGSGGGGGVTGEMAAATFETQPVEGGGVEWASSGVFASVLHDAEAAVAADVANRLQQPRRKPDVQRVRRWLAAAADKEGWRLLSPAQEAFLDLALCEPISVLTGGPGTGKTFATHIAVRLWRAMGRKVLMCAPTGRAAQRLAEIATAGRRMSHPVQSSTIHRLLETRRGARDQDDDDADNDDSSSLLSYKGKFIRDANSPLDADVVVVDESSMLDLPLCAALLAAVKPGAQVVFVGDADQLPSVGPGSVLRDILGAGAVPAVQLREVFRQAEASGIIRAAHAINAGHLPAVPTRRWDPTARTLVVDAPASPGLTLPSPKPGPEPNLDLSSSSRSSSGTALGGGGPSLDSYRGGGKGGGGGGGEGRGRAAEGRGEETAFIDASTSDAPPTTRALPGTVASTLPDGGGGGGGGSGGGSGGGGAEVQYVTETWDGADCVWVTLPDDAPAGYEGALESLFAGALPALAGLNPATDLQAINPDPKPYTLNPKS
jgi:exodeoxyribonuclease V alpha subunit